MKSVKLGEVTDHSGSGNEAYDSGEDTDEEESDWDGDEERETEERYPPPSPHPAWQGACACLVIFSSFFLAGCATNLLHSLNEEEEIRSRNTFCGIQRSTLIEIDGCVSWCEIGQALVSSFLGGGLNRAMRCDAPPCASPPCASVSL